VKQRFKKIIDVAYAQLGEGWFFVAIMATFFMHSAWLALSSNLLPYDEYYHIGIIKYYSNQWSPFIHNQPFEVSYYGDLTRLPSYMYHYLMSFPYRFFHFFTQNEMTLTVILRFINIGLVIGGIILFRQLFIKAGMSRRLMNVVCTFFALTPFVVMLAAENNYDNLMFFMTPIVMTYAYRIVKQTKKSPIDMMMFISTGLFTTLVKHSFVVVFGIFSLYIFWQIIKDKKLAVVFSKTSFKKYSKKTVIVASVIFIIIGGLFIERHGYNLVKYRSVNVNCTKVQSFEVCKNYSPWWRNYRIKQNPPQEELYGNIFSFAQHWGATMAAGLYPIFAQTPHQVGSTPDPYGDYAFKPRLTILLALGYFILACSMLAVYAQRSKLKESKILKMSLVVAGGLVLTLFIFNYRTYLTLGKGYAIQVRYMLPAMIPVFVVFAFSLNHALKIETLKRFATIAALVIYFWCGGVVGWIIRSDNNWYWPNRNVISANQTSQKVLQKIVPN
jgi:hypothetical protein